jgi:hypothetical protein
LRLPDDLRGTFAPFFLASLRPIAIACLRLFTFRPEPLFNVPFFRRRIVDFTLFEAELPYFAIGPPSLLFGSSRWRHHVGAPASIGVPAHRQSRVGI